MNKQVFRVIDSNCNRSAEGLRFLEDIARMILNDPVLSAKLKEIRHGIINYISPLDHILISHRDVDSDVGSHIETVIEQSGLSSLIFANAKRTEEGLRVIEEIAKLPDLCRSIDSNVFKQYRFEVYKLEQVLQSRILRTGKMTQINGVYAIIDTSIITLKDIYETTCRIIKGGASILQLRDKFTSKKELIKITIDLQKLCQEHNKLFIINDYLDIALAANTDGIHLGQNDIPISIARKELPVDKIIGCSVESAEQALKAYEQGADYIAIGSIFPTKTKEGITIVGVDILTEIKEMVDLPLVAIGGITLDNAKQVIDAGADSVAIITAILSSTDMENVTKKFVDKFKP